MLREEKNTNVNVEFLLVAGGGGGGADYFNYQLSYGCSGGGGGGAGGLIYCSSYSFCSDKDVIIGLGGQGGYKCTCQACYTNFACSGENGGDSSFGDIVAYGGGGGAGGGGNTGKSGGSGGGGSAGTSDGCGCPGGSGCSGQGNSGGAGGLQNNCRTRGGGGGGYSGAGCCGYSSGYGGPGYSSSISGTTQYYSCGGNASGGTPNYCGSGGGGAVASGNACNTYVKRGCDGKNGVLIIRYPTSCNYSLSGGCKYTCGNYTIHCFTSSGVLTVG